MDETFALKVLHPELSAVLQTFGEHSDATVRHAADAAAASVGQQASPAPK